MAKLSVITVTRNAGTMLEKTIQSVATQKDADLEYVVVDGASTDGSPEVIERAEAVSRWVSEPDGGIYDAMNKGAAMATGDWVLFLNAGDLFIDPDTASRLLREAEFFPEADVIYGDMVCGPRGKHPERLVRAADRLKPHHMSFCHQSAMCRRELLGRFPFDTRHRYTADFKFFKLLQKERAVFHHAPFAVAYYDATGVSTCNRAKTLADNMRVICETDGLLRGLPSLLRLLPTYLICRMRSR